MFFTIFKFLLIISIFITIHSGSEKILLNDKNILSERQLYTKQITSYMRPEIDPCDDFYEYACGNYFKVNKPKKGIKIQSALLNVENQEIEDFRNILMASPSGSNAVNGLHSSTAIDKIKNAYQSCMNANVFELKKSEAYLKLIDSIGGWPARDPEWKPENFNWFHVMTTLKQYGVDFIITEEVQNDKGGVIFMRPQTFGIVQELMKEQINETRSKPYQINKKLAMKIMKIYGISKRNAERAYDEILEYGEEVAWDDFTKLLMDLSGIAVDDLISIANLTEQTEVYDWEKYFSTLTGQQPVNVTQKSLYVTAVPLPKDMTKIFENKEYLRGAANYAVLKLLYALHQELRSPKYPERFCFFHVQKYMSSIGSLLYSRSKYYSKVNEDEAWTILTYIKKAFMTNIMSLDWMDDVSKNRTVKKLQNMEILFGYMNHTWNEDDIEAEYKDLDIKPNDFYGNNLRLRRLYQKGLHKILTEKSTANEQTTDEFLLIDLNAFYNSFYNKLIIPAVLLQKPFIYPELPKSFNFASIGRIIGHEMIHGFDSVAKNFNENAQPEIWWSNDTMAAYDEREQCLEHEYSTFLIPELNKTINGEDTIQENIADNGGVRQAFYGYKKWLKENGRLPSDDDDDDDSDGNEEMKNDETLLGLNLTNYQLFFLSFGQTYCTRYSSKDAYKLYLEGTYAIEKYRLIGSLSNFDEFSKHFKCKLGTRMNPDKKCILW